MKERLSQGQEAVKAFFGLLVTVPLRSLDDFVWGSPGFGFLFGFVLAISFAGLGGTNQELIIILTLS